jgi:hypothetical protein
MMGQKFRVLLSKKQGICADQMVTGVPSVSSLPSHVLRVMSLSASYLKMSHGTSGTNSWGSEKNMRHLSLGEE